MRTCPPLTALLVVPVCCCVLCCGWVTEAGFAAESRENWATEAYQKNCESVVFIQGDKVEERRGGAVDSERTFNGMGTGVIIDERGYIVTNYHVVKDIRKIQVKTYDEKEYIANLVAKDTDTDLALIKINARIPLKPIAFGRSHDLMPGESCMAIGNPYGYLFSLTDGRISATKRDVSVNDSSLVYRIAIQTNTAINPGNSGGPLINVNGEMIGINVAIRQGANAIAFTTPVDQVVEIAAKLMGEIVQQQVNHGITVSQNEPKDYHAIKRFIIRVDSVESNSPAALAGIQKGDILTGIGKYTLRNKLDFYRALLDLKANDEIAFSLFRNSELVDVTVALGAAKGGVFAQRSAAPQSVAATAASRTAGNAGANNTGMSNSRMDNERPARTAADLDKLVWENLGILYAPITTQEFDRTYQKFLDKFSGGVIVKAVREGSPAERGNLAVGDVIVGIGQWRTESANDIQYIGVKEWAKLRSEGESLPSDIIRENTHYATEIPMR